MSGSWKYLLMLLVLVFAGYFAIKIVFGLLASLVGWILSLAIPILIIGGIAYILYSLINRKALDGGNRRTLP